MAECGNGQGDRVRDSMMKKFIFIHIPRTAGTSMATALTDHIWAFPRRPAGISKWEKIIDNKSSLTLEHACIRQLVDRGALSSEFYENAFKFTFVRNPWDRVLSLYKHMQCDAETLFNTHRKMGYCFLCNAGKDKGGGFKNFVRYLNVVEIEKPGLYNRKGLSQFSPQLNWIPDDIDFVGRYENLKNDFDFVCDKISHPSVDLPHMKKTDRGAFRSDGERKNAPYQELYDDETKDIIYEMYKEEINRFGYEF